MAEELEDNRLLRLAQLGVISGDPALANFGELIIRHDAALRGGASRKSSIGRGFILDSATGEVTRDPTYEEYEKGRDEVEKTQRKQLQDDFLERLGIGETNRRTRPKPVVVPTEGGYSSIEGNPDAPDSGRVSPTIPVTAPIPDSQRATAANLERITADFEKLQRELEANPGAVSTPKAMLEGAFGKTPFIGPELKQAAQGEFYTPEQQAIKAKAATLLNDYVKEMSGLAVSAQEIQRIYDAFPFAPGADYETAMARFPAFIDSVRRRAEAIRGMNRPPPMLERPPAGPAPKRFKQNPDGSWTPAG